MLALFYDRAGVIGGINTNRAKAGCACSMCGMEVVCFFLWGGGGMEEGVLVSSVDGWMTCEYVLFNRIQFNHIRTGDNVRICAMEPSLQLRRFRLERGLNSGKLDQ